MATPTHPNQFALGQHVLWQAIGSDSGWREGTIIVASVDDRRTRHSENGPIRENTHEDGCDGFIYGIAPEEYYSLPRGYGDVVTECQCDVLIVDADPTGRWTGQRLTTAEELALALVDTNRRNGALRLEPAIDTTSTPEADVVMLVEVHPSQQYLATVRLDDLVSWASGVRLSTGWQDAPAEEE